MKRKTIKKYVSIFFYLFFIAVIVFASNFNDILVQKNNANLEHKGWHEYDYGVESRDIVILSLILILFIVITSHLFLRNSKNQKRENISTIVIPAITLQSINVLCLLDTVLSSWSIPQRCGDGFDIGNCFLLDGLGMIIYYFSVPILYVLAVSLFVANRILRRKKGSKRKRSTQSDNPGIL